MLKIRKGDTVEVITGEDKGKKGKILRILPSGKRAIVEGINFMKKHKRRTRDDQQGGIVSVEAPLELSNLMFFCKQCNQPRRIGFSLSKEGTKTRICKACKEAL